MNTFPNDNGNYFHRDQLTEAGLWAEQPGDVVEAYTTTDEQAAWDTARQQEMLSECGQSAEHRATNFVRPRTAQELAEFRNEAARIGITLPSSDKELQGYMLRFYAESVRE